MQLSYRGRSYTSISAGIATVEHSFQGQFLGMSTPLTATYRNGQPSGTISLTYRGQSYLSDR